jgi:hypothetical protein
VKICEIAQAPEFLWHRYKTAENVCECSDIVDGLWVMVISAAGLQLQLFNKYLIFSGHSLDQAAHFGIFGTVLRQ